MAFDHPGRARNLYAAMFRGRKMLLPSHLIFLSVWKILGSKKGSEDCDDVDVGLAAGGETANPILISEEQKAERGKVC